MVGSIQIQDRFLEVEPSELIDELNRGVRVRWKLGKSNHLCVDFCQLEIFPFSVEVKNTSSG